MKEAVTHKVDKYWDILCRGDSHFRGCELVEQCKIPIGIACPYDEYLGKIDRGRWEEPPRYSIHS